MVSTPEFAKSQWALNFQGTKTNRHKRNSYKKRMTIFFTTKTKQAYYETVSKSGS